jgi:hypothetical protein
MGRVAFSGCLKKLFYGGIDFDTHVCHASELYHYTNLSEWI